MKWCEAHYKVPINTIYEHGAEWATTKLCKLKPTLNKIMRKNKYTPMDIDGIDLLLHIK